MAKMTIAGIGVSTVESIPVFHYYPGGSSLRVITYSHNYVPFDCDDLFSICIYGKGPDVFEPVNMGLDHILALAKNFHVDIILFEGLDPLESLQREVIDMFRGQGFKLGVRIIGGSTISPLPDLDLLVIDDIHMFSDDPGLIIDTMNLLERIRENSNPWIEVNTYMKRPALSPIAPLIRLTGEKGIPIHIHIADHEGGGPISDLYSKAKDLNPFTYIHNPLYPYLDTYCPFCGAPIAIREDGMLLSLEAPENKCWKCGKPLPLRGKVRKKTPRNLLIVTGTEKWLSIREIKTLNSFFQGTLD
ncbi:MAG: hypothetical protein GSR72_02175 [Desulfurococcales archaeon]|nr:hypothetical protein [Desulfurococcales archaeon]